jgi:predicted membrane chloride channel (bestrophin family)
MLWLFALPASVATVATPTPTLVTLVAGTAFVAWLLLGIDDIGMQLEQPYTVMALAQFCDDVAREVTEEVAGSDWTPRVETPRDEMLVSEYLNPAWQDEENRNALRIISQR